MPPDVQRRPSETPYHSPHMGSFHEPDPRLTSQKVTQQQQHREALRLALGSILAPKRAQMSPNSRPTSGAASPAYPFSGSISGTHTPAGTPPPHHGMGAGPNSSDYLHPSHGYLHGPSKLGRTTPNSVTPTDSSPSSTHPSPRPTMVHPAPLPAVQDIEPLPLPPRVQESDAPISKPVVTLPPSALPARPAISPLQSSNEVPVRPSSMPGLPIAKAGDATRGPGVAPKSSFLQTLQSKSAWDALIHGSFS